MAKPNGISGGVATGGVATPYTGSDSGWGGSAGNGSGTVSATADGAILTNYIWVPDYAGEPYPKNVIVVETCDVYTTANYGAPLSATADNGLGATPVTSSSQYFAYAEAYSTRYKVVTGAASLSFTCTPTAKGSITHYGYTTVNVNYSISIKPVQISLTGTTKLGGAPYLLTGQPVTATLDAGGYPLATVNGATGIPTWSKLDSSVCFGSYDCGAVGQVNPIVYSAASLAFYTKADKTVIVSCTANVTLPDGTTPGVSAESKFVSSKPSGNWTIYSGSVGFDPGYTVFGLFGTVDHPRGQDWKAKITAPAPFDQTGGQLAFLQESDALKKYTFDPAYAQPNVLYWPDANSRRLGLDTGFPLSYWMFTLGEQSKAGDSPKVTAENSTVGKNIRAVSIDGSYTTWIMFKPAGNGTQWVPIQVYSWSVHGSAQRDSNDAWTGSGTPSSPSMTMGSLTDDHPTWSFVRPSGDQPPSP